MQNPCSPFISIRRGTQADTSTLVKFNIAMAQETEAKQLELPVIRRGVETLLTHDRYGFYLVAECDKSEVIASLMITIEWSDWRNSMFWWVQSVYVLPEWRRKSVYSRLYHYVKQLAEREEGVCGFRLYVEKNNIAAQNTYKKLGMQATDYLLFEEMLPE